MAKVPASSGYAPSTLPGGGDLSGTSDLVGPSGYAGVDVGPGKDSPEGPPPTGPGTQGTSSGGGGGGGGGGSSADRAKAYINYYKRILNLKPNMALVRKAVAGKYTMQEFQLLIQREDTNRYLRTSEGQQVAQKYRDLWARIFPSLGRGPGIKSLRLFLQDKPAKGLRDVTNPTSIRSMYVFLSRTKLFKKIYPEFDTTEFARTLNFAGYRKYKDEFRNVMRQYTGRFANDEEISYFFNSRISPDQFEKNMSIVMSGSPAYRWGTGEKVDPKQQQLAMYGRRGGMITLQRIAAEVEKQQGFMRSKQADFGIKRAEGDRMQTVNAY